MANQNIPASVAIRAKPNFFDVFTILLIIAAGITIASATRHIYMPTAEVIHLEPKYLPRYALLTTLRMFVALIASLIFTFTYGVLAAKSKRAERILIPIIDILQSVPVLGFLTFTIVFFMNLFPGRILGVELAAIFAIFTAQAWNMALSLYQTLKTIPEDMSEVAQSFGLTSWQRFWKLEAPAAMPGLIWNTMMSMSGSWFMIVFSETVTVDNKDIVLPGIGSYAAEAISQSNIHAIYYAIIAMFLVILVYDQILFRPLVAWAEKFRFETTKSDYSKTPWLLKFFQRTSFIRWLNDHIAVMNHAIAMLPIGKRPFSVNKYKVPSKVIDLFYIPFVIILTVGFAYYIYNSLHQQWTMAEALHVSWLGILSLIRIAIILVVASIIWLPIGIWLGLRPEWAKKSQVISQFLAAFPANLLFPFFVMAIVHYNLNSNIWLTPLMILGAQWYILFNVIAGASTLPGDLREVAKNFNIKGKLWWFKIIIPAVFPYYVTGALTAYGGAWNATIAAELASWGKTTLVADGLGAYISVATSNGDMFKLGLGMVIMSAYVILFNHILWQPLYNYSKRRFAIA